MTLRAGLRAAWSTLNQTDSKWRRRRRGTDGIYSKSTRSEMISKAVSRAVWSTTNQNDSKWSCRQRDVNSTWFEIKSDLIWFRVDTWLTEPTSEQGDPKWFRKRRRGLLDLLQIRRTQNDRTGDAKFNKIEDQIRRDLRSGWLVVDRIYDESGWSDMFLKTDTRAGWSTLNHGWFKMIAQATRYRLDSRSNQVWFEIK